MTNFVGGMIFGSIGFAAFIYGKKMGYYKMMFIGFLLCVFPYFVSSNLVLYTIGAGLTAALFFLKD